MQICVQWNPETRTNALSIRVESIQLKVEWANQGSQRNENLYERGLSVEIKLKIMREKRTRYKTKPSIPKLFFPNLFAQCVNIIKPKCLLVSDIKH